MTKVIAVNEKSRFKTVLKARHHEWTTDEPPEQDGTDLGPTPSELLCGSLASCTAITMRMYADRKEWEVSRIEVSVSYEVDDEEEFLTRMVKTIKCEGDLDEKQRNRLHQIGSKCPIEKILTHPITIESITL